MIYRVMWRLHRDFPTVLEYKDFDTKLDAWKLFRSIEQTMREDSNEDNSEFVSIQKKVSDDLWQPLEITYGDEL